MKASQTTPAQPPILALTDVSVHRGDQDVVRGLNWTIGAGESWAVLGANGAGKSSLASAIGGDAAISGEIDYGFDYTGDPCERIASVSFRLHRSFVAQADSYYQSRWYIGEEEATCTARQALRTVAGRTASAQKRIAAVARKLNIVRCLDRQTLHLSTGEMRRLLIARAILMNPALLVLDEPFIGLDISGRQILSRALDDLMRHGHQLIFLTARPWELPARISHALFLKSGDVVGMARRGSTTFTRFERDAFQAARKMPAPVPLRAASSRVSTKPGAESPAVNLNDINLRAGDVEILKNIDWIVGAGERWALSGPNGAGKTTLLSMLNGDHPQAFAQDVNLFGRPRGDFTLWELKAAVGWAAPEIALHYDAMTTTLEFICTGYFETLGLYHTTTARQRSEARNWLRYFGLNHAAERPFRVLSDGEQRVALIARAMAKHRRLLILDEPCQGLDAGARTRVLSAIDDFCRDRRTALIIVTHYSDELPHCITHRLELRNKRVARSVRLK